MNVINRKTSDKDPFQQSDRDFSGPGKGDRDRSGPLFKRHFPRSMGRSRCKPGKTIFRYP